MDANSELREKCRSIIRALRSGINLGDTVDSVLGMPGDLPIRPALAAGLIAASARSDDMAEVRLAALLEISKPAASYLGSWSRLRPMIGQMADNDIAELAPKVIDECVRAVESYLESGQTADPIDLIEFFDLATGVQPVRSIAADWPTIEPTGGFDLGEEPVHSLSAGAGTDPAVAELIGRLRRDYGLGDERQDRLMQMAVGSVAELHRDVRIPGHLGQEQDILGLLVQGGSLLRGGEETDLSRIDEAVNAFRQAAALASSDHPMRGFVLCSVALALLRRSEVIGHTLDLHEALDLLETAKEVLQPNHPQWTLAAEMQSAARQRLGGATGGWAGSHAFRGLVSSERRPVALSELVRHVTTSSIDAAHRSVVDGNLLEAISIIDEGRSMLLAAATGQPLSAPTPLEPDQIQLALSTLQADALVYLIPGTGSIPGLLIALPCNGPPMYMALPDLAIDRHAAVERYLTAIAALGHDPCTFGDSLQFTNRLAEICDWAWQAAIGPMLTRELSSLSTLVSGRVPRVILIPVGELTRIPWHAARRGDGTYAVELAAFSYAVSAHTMIDNAAQPPTPLSPTGLIVGDPETEGKAGSLRGARAEAHAIRQAFYPGARYLGRRQDDSVSRSGAGTVDQVREWLTDSRLTAGTMLHLACHGSFVTNEEEVGSYLLLASGERLSGAELVRTMNDAPNRRVGLVVLSACHTGRTVEGFDEAFSLSAAFLTGGARSVVSCLWEASDQATAAVMFMFHHYLLTGVTSAGEALRLTQLWMLDDARAIPDTMPSQLRPGPSGDRMVNAALWAGFVHWGQ